MVDTGRN